MCSILQIFSVYPKIQTFEITELIWGAFHLTWINLTFCKCLFNIEMIFYKRIKTKSDSDLPTKSEWNYWHTLTIYTLCNYCDVICLSAQWCHWSWAFKLRLYFTQINLLYKTIQLDVFVLLLSSPLADRTNRYTSVGFVGCFPFDHLDAVYDGTDTQAQSAASAAVSHGWKMSFRVECYSLEIRVTLWDWSRYISWKTRKWWLSGYSRKTYLVSRVIAGHVTFPTVDTHLFIYKSLDLRAQGKAIVVVVILINDILLLSVIMRRKPDLENKKWLHMWCNVLLFIYLFL